MAIGVFNSAFGGPGRGLEPLAKEDMEAESEKVVS